MKFVKKFLKTILIIIVLAIVCGALYIGYLDISGSKAKDYLVQEYNYSRYKYFVYKITNYVFEDDVDCNNLWFKECSSDVNMYRDVYIINIETKEKIKVTLYQDGTITDDMKKTN